MRRAVSKNHSRDVDVPPVRRVVGAMRNAELAFVAEVGETGQILSGQSLRLAVHLGTVEGPKEDVEGGTEVVAAAAGVADVRDPSQLRVYRSKIVEIVRLRIKHVASAPRGACALRAHRLAARPDAGSTTSLAPCSLRLPAARDVLPWLLRELRAPRTRVFQGQLLVPSPHASRLPPSGSRRSRR